VKIVGLSDVAWDSTQCVSIAATSQAAQSPDLREPIAGTTHAHKLAGCPGSFETKDITRQESPLNKRVVVSAISVQSLIPLKMSLTRGNDRYCKAKRYRTGELQLDLKKNEGLILSSFYATIPSTKAARDAIGRE